MQTKLDFVFVAKLYTRGNKSIIRLNLSFELEQLILANIT